MLQAQLSGERQANLDAQKRRLEENVQRLRATIETNRRDQAVLAERLKSLQQIEAMQEQLVAENFGAKMQLLEARDRRLEVERSLINGRSRDLELAKELAAAEAERSALNRGWRQKTLEDLLYYFPRRYDDYTNLKPINRLEYGEVVRLGSNDPIQVDVRIVSATNSPHSTNQGSGHHAGAGLPSI